MYVYERMHVCMHDAYACICMYVLYIHVYTHTHTHTHTYKHVQALAGTP